MGVPTPLPCFVLHGLRAGCLSFGVLRGREVFLLGTQDGKCQIYSACTYKKIQDVYADPQDRAMVSVGFIDDSRIWVHIRSHAILILERPDLSEADVYEWRIVSSKELAHYGFCNALCVDSGNTLIYPDAVKDDHYVCISSGEAETRISLGPKAAPLAICSDSAHVDKFFIGDDSGLLRRINQTGQIEEEVAIATEPIFSIASSSTALAIGTAKPPIRVRSIDDLNVSLVDIQYPVGSTGCGSLLFSKSEKTLFAGFWDGSIRGFAMTKKNFGVIILHLSFHSQSINCLKYSADERLFACSADYQKLSVWKLK